MSYLKSLKLLLSFIRDLQKNEKYLNDDEINNYRVCQEVCRQLIDKLDISINVKGKRNIPSYEPALIAVNHKSFFDIILLVSVIERAMPFASAKELMKYPFLKKYIDAIGCVLIDRETEDIKVMKEQLKNLEDTLKTKGIILFPEGECSYKSDEIKDFKKGGFSAASKNDIIIVPSYINYGKMINIGKWYLPEENVEVYFGEPFVPSELSLNKVNSKRLADYSKSKVVNLKINSLK